MRSATTFEAGSIRTSVGEQQSVTQTEPSPTARPAGCVMPVSIVATTSPAAGSTCVTSPSNATLQRPPSPKRLSTAARTGAWPNTFPLPAATSVSESGCATAWACELCVPPVVSRTPAAAAKRGEHERSGGQDRAAAP